LVVILAAVLEWQTSMPSANQREAPKIWTAFECAAYAELVENDAEAMRLLALGFKSGKAFLEAAIANGTPFRDLWSQLPDDVTKRLEGPTVEFLLGRVFEAAHQRAYDRVMRQDEYGAWLPVAEWRYTRPAAYRCACRIDASVA
jgi:hypothetical protein